MRRFSSILAATAVAGVAVLALLQVGCGQSPKRPAPKVTTTQTATGLTLDFGNGVTMNFVLLPPGEFVMGWEDTSGPGVPAGTGLGMRHKVKLTKPFYMGIHEVTQVQYEMVMGVNPSYFQNLQCPVDKVSWNDAVGFCQELSRLTGLTVRLPTEAEWEYACRAGSTTRFCFGDNEKELGDYAWYDENYGGNGSHPVGQRKANAWGLYDMYGNVSEWCSDWYSLYSTQPQVDPRGPPSGETRIRRGGSVFHGADSCSSAYRSSELARSKEFGGGFRVVVETSP